MHRPLHIVLFISCWLPCLLAKGSSYAQRLPLERVEVGRYAFEATMPQAYLLRLDFAGARFNQAVSWQEGQRWRQIDLVFTLYPKQPEEWKVGYDSLLERRFRNLEARMPGAFRDSTTRWRLVIQTDCNSMATARGLFHGFVCYPAEAVPRAGGDAAADDTWRYARFDTTKLRANYRLVEQVLRYEKHGADSTAMQIVERHPEWRDALVVMDWTASMYKQGAMLLRWQERHQAEGRVRRYVFFNDGDQRYDDEKVVGETGGIYQAACDSLPALLPVIEAVTLGGEGGDHRENDLEAILEGLAACPECKEVILVADNSGPVRDMALLDLVDRPVHVVLCNAFNDQIDPDYLDIATHMGGSLHTRDRDLADIAGQARGGILSVGEQQYVRKNGHWQVYKPRN